MMKKKLRRYLKDLRIAPVSLREHLELQIQLNKALVDKEVALIEKARILQATEYERRLTDLNHAHELNTARNIEFVRVTRLESFEREFRDYKETTEKALTLAAGEKGGISRTVSVIITAAGFLLTMMLIAVAGITIYTKPTPAPIVALPLPTPSPMPVSVTPAK